VTLLIVLCVLSDQEKDGKMPRQGKRLFANIVCGVQVAADQRLQNVKRGIVHFLPSE
jgi:hypothetical protein